MGTIITDRAGVTLAGMTEAEAQTPATPAIRGNHQPRLLPFGATKLNGISEKLIKSHWENNCSGAVKALNVLEQRLAATLADKICSHTFTTTSSEKNLFAPARRAARPLLADAINAIKHYWGGYEQ